MIAATRRPLLVITLGDPCGIGPELLLASLAVCLTLEPRRGS